jgi:hypothetical protein
VCYHVFNEGGNNRRMYYHVNFTGKTRDNDDLLFFAETISEQRDSLVVSCICRINPSDKGISFDTLVPNFRILPSLTFVLA